MSLKPRILIAAALSIALFSTAVCAQQKDDSIDKLTDLIVTTVPMGYIFDALAKKDVNWPVQDNPEKISAIQLACLRSDLSSAGYKRNKAKDVTEYAKKNPSRIQGDIELLNSGAAFLMNRFMVAGSEQELTGVPVDENRIISEANITQVTAFMNFMTKPEFAVLRDLAGVGSAVDMTKSESENNDAGKQTGANLAMNLMLRGVGNCNIPPSALF